MNIPEPAVLREALRQGERILSLQDETRESVLRRAAELLRLAVATVGGVLVVTGLLSATSAQVTRLVFAGFAIAVLFQVISIGILAALLSGGRTTGGFAYGPDMRRVAAHLRGQDITEVGFLFTLLETQPDWIEESERAVGRLQKMNAASMFTLAMGTLFLLMSLIYILGVHILD